MISPGEALTLIKSKYWNDVPVDVFGLAKELGLGPEISTQMPDNISGKIIRTHSHDHWRIIVNGRHALVRQRFTVAHEIGHFIFHRNLLGMGVGDTLAYRADGTDLPNPRIGPKQEWQANNFAANLLIPDHYLRAARAIGFIDITELANRFGVSTAAIRIKLGLTRDTPIEEEHDEEPLLPWGERSSS